MKAKILITLMALFIAATVTFAKSPQTELQQTIKNQISYPSDLVKKFIQGTVFVEFTVKENGRIEVLNCNSLSGDLMVCVVDQLSLITIPAGTDLTGQKFMMRFDFILE